MQTFSINYQFQDFVNYIFKAHMQYIMPENTSFAAIYDRSVKMST